jgi:hypothetical protein
MIFGVILVLFVYPAILRYCRLNPRNLLPLDKCSNLLPYLSVELFANLTEVCLEFCFSLVTFTYNLFHEFVA